jgi:ACR3 family arsenite transporter
VIALLAVPILIQVYFNSGLAYLLNRWAGEQHRVAGTIGPDRREQLLRTRCGGCDQPFGFNSGAPWRPSSGF